MGKKKEFVALADSTLDYWAVLSLGGRAGTDEPTFYIMSDLCCVVGLGEPVLVQLQSPDSPHKIEAGNDVILRCIVDGSGEIHIDWYRWGTWSINNFTASV
jgi:hypothetical protein